MMTEYSIESGIVAYQQGDKAQAAVIFTALVKQDPNYADAWFWLGRSIEDPQRARYCFERAASLNPFLSTRSYIYEDPDDKPKNQAGEEPVKPPRPSPLLTTIAEPARPPVFEQPSAPPQISPPPPAAPPPPPPPAPPQSPFYAVEPDPLPPTLSNPVGSEPEMIRRSDKIMIGLIAALISFLALSTPGFLLIRGGAIDTRLQPELFKSKAPSVAISPTATALPQPDSTATARPTATLTPTPSSEADIEGILDQVYALEDTKEFEKAIVVLDKAIRKYPQFDHFYNLRAYNYGQLTSGLHSQSEYLTYLNQAISDQQKSISLPHSEMFFWTYYGNLANYYDDLAASMVLRSEEDAYNLLSYQNHLLAYENGGDVDTLYGAARDLTELGRWDEAAKILDEIEQNASSLTSDYYEIKAEILRSQKKYKESVELIETMGSGCAMYYTRSLFQYEAGLTDDAFESINTCITGSPYFGGYRYFLRALIYLDRKEYDLARQDLSTGEKYTWAVHGLHDYVMAKLLLKDGERENGIYYMQMAEASMPYQMGPILDRVRKELKQLGAKPITPEAPLEDLPTAQPTTGARLTPIPTSRPVATQAATGDIIVMPNDPSVSSELPPGHYFFMVVDPQQALAQKKVLADSSLDLHFQLPAPKRFASIESFSLIFTQRYPLQEIPLQIMVWVPLEGWAYLANVKWGENTINDPSRLITADGDIYISIVDPDDRSVVMQELQFSMRAQLSDGSSLVMEAKP
jgi:tetratricopeptide (TPR) repeat protein